MSLTPLRQTRGWVVTAAGLGQVAASRAGMLPWWVLLVTVVLTVAVARQTGPVDEQRARIARGAAVAGVGAFAVFIAVRAIAGGRTGSNPLATMRSLTEALVILSLAMAPTWRTPRDYRVWLSVTTGVLVAAAMGSHSLTTDVLLIAAWVVVLLAMASIQRAALLAAVTAHASSTVPEPSGRLGTSAPVFASMIAGLLVFLALPAGLGGSGLAPHLPQRSGDGSQGPASSRTTVGVDTGGGGTLSLLVRGALPTTPLLRVPTDSPALWRGSIYTTYTGDSWQAAPSERFAFVPGDDVSVPSSAIDPPPNGPTRTDRAEFASGLHSSLIWAPGVPLQVRGDGGEIQGLARAPANVRIIGAQQISGYTVTSAIAPTSPAELNAATGPAKVGAEWTALPAELPASVSQLARQVTAGAATSYDKVRDLEAYLRDHETYSLGSPIPGPGEDAVSDFLFRDHTGFCEQFASAEAVLLRTLDVPARVVSGLAYGIRQGGTRLLTAADAHAWVEVYYPGIGWSPTDPTAGVTLAAPSSSARSPITALLHRISVDLPGGRIGLIALLVVLILTATSIGRTMRSRAIRLRREPRAHPAARPVLAAFHRFARHHPRPTARAPDETAREYVGRVTVPGRLDTAVETLEQECYGTRAPGVSEVKEAVSAFDGER